MQPLPFDGTILPELVRGSYDLFNWDLPTEGINLQGGFATFRHGSYLPEQVFLKRMSKNDVCRAVICDQLKSLFPGGPQTTGSHYARIAFDMPITMTRQLKSGKQETVHVTPDSKPHWFLILRRVDQPVLRQYLHTKFQLAQPPPILWLPNVPAFVEAFAGTFAYRMVLGVKDPGPGNFLVRDEPLAFWSLDEGSAFSPELEPGSGKPWLVSNLGKSKRSTDIPLALGRVSSTVAALCKTWRAQANLADDIHAIVFQFDTLLGIEECQRIENYVLRNLKTLETDWAKFCDVSATEKKLAQVTLASSKLAAPLALPAVQEGAFFDKHDLANSYYRETYRSEQVNEAYSKAEITSLLQKAIRRNLPDLAHISAALLLASFQVTKLCNRLMTIATEDIGIGNMECIELAVALDKLRERLYSTEKIQGSTTSGMVARWRQDLRNNLEFRRALHHCVAVMCVSPKTRLGDHMSMVLFNPAQNLKLDVGVLRHTLAELMSHERGDTRGEEFFMRFLSQHIGTADLPAARGNADAICQVIIQRLKFDYPILLPAANACAQSIVARNATKPTKLAGKTSLATLVLLCTRRLSDIKLRLDEGRKPADFALNKIYSDLIAGRNLPAIPAWAKDKHTTYVPDGNFIFVVREQAALEPVHVVADPYVERAIAYCKAKDEHEKKDGKSKKRSNGKGDKPAKKQRSA